MGREWEQDEKKKKKSEIDYREEMEMIRICNQATCSTLVGELKYLITISMREKLAM